jgi:protein AroM
MALPLVGTITIGQAPRQDVTPIIEAHLPHGTWCVHVGLLDGLATNEIEEQFGFREGGRMFVSRLADGHSVDLDADRIEDGVRKALAKLESRGCSVIVLLCTGVFHGLECERAWLVEPDRVIPPVVAALFGSRRVGVIVPAESQIEAESFKWSGLAVRPAFAAASPYSDDVVPLQRAAAALRDGGVYAILLDCIGFTEQHRAVVARAAGVPVLLSNAITARVAGELVAAGNGE